MIPTALLFVVAAICEVITVIDRSPLVLQNINEHLNVLSAQHASVWLVPVDFRRKPTRTSTGKIMIKCYRPSEQVVTLQYGKAIVCKESGLRVVEIADRMFKYYFATTVTKIRSKARFGTLSSYSGISNDVLDMKKRTYFLGKPPGFRWTHMHIKLAINEVRVRRAPPLKEIWEPHGAVLKLEQNIQLEFSFAKNSVPYLLGEMMIHIGTESVNNIRFIREPNNSNGLVLLDDELRFSCAPEEKQDRFLVDRKIALSVDVQTCTLQFDISNCLAGDKYRVFMMGERQTYFETDIVFACPFVEAEAMEVEDSDVSSYLD